MACWRDDIHGFSMNEVAINWNAPLVWVASWLAQGPSARAGIDSAGRRS